MGVWINDLYVPLYNFWVQLRDRGQDLSESVREQKEKMLESGTQEEKDKFAKGLLFNQYAAEIDTYDNFQKAVAFFMMNKCSYSGLTENSSFSRTAANSNFSLVGADKLAQFSQLIKNWKITNIDYSEVMNADGPENTFVLSWSSLWHQRLSVWKESSDGVNHSIMACRTAPKMFIECSHKSHDYMDNVKCPTWSHYG